jgi:hypothetical protein
MESGAYGKFAAQNFNPEIIELVDAWIRDIL